MRAKDENKNKLGLRLLFYFGGLIIMTLGVAISVKSDLGVTTMSRFPNPEGFLSAASKITKIKFGTVKVICDVAMVIISLVTCLIAIHSLGSVGIGTIVAAFMVGTEVKMMTKYWGAARDNLLRTQNEEKSISNNS